VRTVAFVAPFALPTTARFVRAVAALPGVRCVAVVHEPPKLDLGGALLQPCRDVFDRRALGAALDQIVRECGGLHRILGVLEDLQEPIAAERERLGIPGLGRAAAARFRDKNLMKAALRAAGVPVAPSLALTGGESAEQVAAAVGLPLVLKPVAGAGSVATTRVDTVDRLAQVLPSMPLPALAEGFLTGTEHSMETWVLDGRPMLRGGSRYYPSALEVAENPHLQWCVHLPIDESPFADAPPVVDRALQALGMTTGITHAEWFRRSDGSVVIGEIAARPPGARLMDLHSAAVDADLYAAWAALVVDGRFTGPWSRRWSVAGVYLRGPGHGRVVGVDGLDEAQRKLGVHVVQAQLPQPGQARAGGYEGDGFVMIRHREDRVVLDAVRELFATLRVRYA
jgi:hypothetical protein